MRKLSELVVVFGLLTSSGCSWNDALFNTLGDYYSGGGTTSTEKRAHHDSVIERWNGYQP